MRVKKKSRNYDKMLLMYVNLDILTHNDSMLTQVVILTFYLIFMT